LRSSEYVGVAADSSPVAPEFGGDATQLRDLVAYVGNLDGVKVGPNLAARQVVTREEMDAVLSPKAGDWPSYNGDVNGNRYSLLTNINAGNGAKVKATWVHPLPYSPVEATPIVVDGVMYMTAPNQVVALDGRTGSEIWSYSRP